MAEPSIEMIEASAARARVREACDRLLRLGGVRDAVRHHGFSFHDGAVHYIEAGGGQPVVLIHGAGGGCANWYRLIGPIAARYRVLAPDLPGFGESDAVAPHPPLGAQAAARLGTWLDATASPPWILVGTSFGGLAALRLAQARPADVRAVVLVDVVGVGTSLPLLVRLAAMRRLRGVLLRPSRRGTALLFRLLLTSNRDGIAPDHEQALIDYLHAADMAGGAAQLEATLAHFASWQGQREVLTAAELATLPMPVLVAWGERDRFVPVSDARSAASALPRAELRILEDAGHSPNWEAAEELTTAVLQFLDRLPRAVPSVRSGDTRA